MLTFTWAELNREPLVKAMVKLNNCDKLDERTAYRIGRMVQLAGREMEKARQQEFDLAKKYAALNEAGEIIVNNGMPQWKDEDASKAFSKELEQLLHDTKVSFKVHKLDFHALHNAGLTGAEMVALEPIIEGLPEVA